MSMSDSTSPPPPPPPPPPSTPTGEEEKKPSPYNMYVALASLGGAVAVFLLVSAASCSSGLIKTPADFATVSAAMGGLFTLIGTVVGAYFGIKSSGDAHDRTQEANKRALDESDKARKASLMVNPKDTDVDLQNLL
jgi:hypothetical protein